MTIQTEFMKEAYGLFYKIETTLRQIIESRMKEEYGIDWLLQAPLSMRYPT